MKQILAKIRAWYFRNYKSAYEQREEYLRLNPHPKDSPAFYGRSGEARRIIGTDELEKAVRDYKKVQ